MYPAEDGGTKSKGTLQSKRNPKAGKTNLHQQGFTDWSWQRLKTQGRKIYKVFKVTRGNMAGMTVPSALSGDNEKHTVVNQRP